MQKNGIEFKYWFLAAIVNLSIIPFYVRRFLICCLLFLDEAEPMLCFLNNNGQKYHLDYLLYNKYLYYDGRVHNRQL